MHALARLLPYYRRHRALFWLGIGLLLLARVFEAGIPLLLKAGIDGLAARDVALGAIAGGILGLTFLRGVSIYAGRRITRRIGVAVAYDLRNRLYAHLQRQGPAFFARHRTGDLMARAINDIGLIRQLVALGTRTVLVLVFSALVGLVFMLRESPSLTLLLLPPLPMITVAAWLLSRRLHAQSLAVQAGFSTLSERAQENLGGIRTIQALVQEEPEIRRFAAASQDYAEKSLALVRTQSLLGAWMPALGACSTLVVLGLGGSRVLAGEITLGTFTAFLWYLNMVLWPVREAGNMINLFQRGAAGCVRLFELLDEAPEIEDAPAPDPPARLAGAIELRGLDYRHPHAARPALDGVSLSVAPGECVAVVGRVGSGKSTLLRVLVRLLDPAPGRVLFDGRDLCSLPLALVRRDVALLPQEPFLFSETIRGNVGYVDRPHSEQELRDALAAADLAETLAALPEEIETQVGERGVLLSGGQKQRVTLARALVRDAPILLLDDPFASVDAETEERILRRLAELRRGKTTLLVSHRISAVRAADRILVLDEGRVAEVGRHDELVARGGLYAALDRVQRRRERLLGDLERAEGGEAA
jgi:ATP-binding cassette subfamily B protein